MHAQKVGRRIALTGFLVAALLVSLGGCLSPGGGEKEGGGTGGKAAAPAADNASGDAARAEAAFGRDDIASVNGSKITLEEMRQALATDTSEKHQLLMARAEEEYLLSFANRRSLSRMLFLEATRRGIVPPDLERHLVFDKMFLVKSEYAGVLVREAKAPPGALEKGVPRNWERIRLQELLVADEETARSAEGRLKAGESFDALVEEMSTGPAADKKGKMDFIWFYPNNNLFDLRQSEILFGLKEGEVSPVLKTPLGFGLYKFLERHRLSDAEKRLGYSNLEAAEKERIVKRVIAGLYEKHKIWSMDTEQKPKEFFALFDDWYSKKVPVEKVKKAVVGKVDDFEIRYGDVLYAVSQGPKTPGDQGKIDLFETQRTMLGRIVEAIVLSREAGRNGYKVSPYGQLELDWKRESLTVRHFQDVLFREKADLSEEALKKFQQANAARYTPGPSVAILHLFVQENRKTKDVYDSLARGEEFAAVAGRLSEGYPLGVGADLGYVREKDLDGTIGKKVFALGVGEVSRPIPYRDGFLVVKVYGKKDLKAGDSRSARGRVKADFETAEKVRVYGDLMKEIRPNYRFALNEKEKPRILGELAEIRKRVESEKKIQRGLHHGG